MPEYDRTASARGNTSVDNISEQSGTIDTLPSLSFGMPDSDVIRNLDLRINDSRDYWDNPKEYDLKNVRNENFKLALGKINETGLYRHQKPYKENQIFLGEESITSYVTAQMAPPVVIPASAEARSKLFAGDLEKAIKAHGEDIVDLERIVELSVRNIRIKRISIIKFHYDKSFGKHGDIISESLNPEHVILDKNASLGSNPQFICHVLKKSVDELITMFPNREAAILKLLGIQRRTSKQMTQELAVREVWVTHYDKKNMPQEGVVWYMQDLVLEKTRNPNWLYASENLNLLKFPKKPFIFGNLVNYGDHLIDDTTPLEQAAEQQMILNRRGRQIMENADKANGLLIISTDSGLDKADGQNITGDPNQKLFIKTSGQPVEDLVHQLEAQILPPYVINDKLDARMQIGNLLGAPTDFTGSQADDGDPTLGEVMVKKNQSAGIQDKMVRAVSRMLKEYYQYLVQMMIVWYTQEHSFVHDSGDGEFDYITLKRGLIEEGIRVKAGKPTNPDSSHVEAITMGLLKIKGISLLDAYKLLQLDNPQQLYDNWAKQSADPASLARDALDGVDESEAYVIFADIMDGKKVQDKENPTREYVMSLRKLMINDDFLKAPKARQSKFIDYVNKCLDSLEEHLLLEEASDSGPEGMRPEQPLPPLSSLMQPQGAPPMGQSPQPPMPPPGMAPGAGQPPMAPPQSQPQGAPSPSSIFAGTGLPNQPNPTAPVM